MGKRKLDLLKAEFNKNPYGKSANLLVFFYMILHIKHANTHAKNNAIREIMIGKVNFFVFAPAK